MEQEVSAAGSEESTPSSPQVVDEPHTCPTTAVRSVDALNDLITRYLSAPDNALLASDFLKVPDHETLKSSMLVMRTLLADAQSKFRNMVEENGRLATITDDTKQTADEVATVGDELRDAKQTLPEATSGSDVIDAESPDVKAEDKLTGCGDCAELSEGSKTPTEGGPGADLAPHTERIAFLEEENERLKQEINSLSSQLSDVRRQLASKEWGGVRPEADGDDGCGGRPVTSEEAPDAPDMNKQVNQLKEQLYKAHETIRVLKGDRKKLKSEKLELLGQLKQLYTTLEDKEMELRHFIRSYEQRMCQADHTIKQLAAEKEASEVERWKAGELCGEKEEALGRLRADLADKERAIADLTERIHQVQNEGGLLSISQLSTSSLPRTSSKEEHLQRSTEVLPTYQEASTSAELTGIPAFLPTDSSSSIKLEKSPSIGRVRRKTSKASTAGGSAPSSHSNSSVNLAIGQQATERPDKSAAVPLEVDGVHASLAADNAVQRRRRDRSREAHPERRRKSPGGLSRMFSRSRSRRSLATCDPNIDERVLSNHLSLLTPDNYQEKLALVTYAAQEPVQSWRANHVLAWLEMDMNMPGYGRACSENIKSGKVLLGLSDAELDTALGLQSPLHRRKLRLAIEELREPTNVVYPKAGGMDHSWVADNFLSDIGLTQHRSVFREQLVDARLLNVITRKDLERYLKVNKKFEQTSILHGVEMLRRVQFNKQTLRDRRDKKELGDLLVWSNQRLISWLEAIDLHEYAHNLLETGVHGALMTLEATFNSDILAGLLAIPTSKCYVRRHLSTEMDALVRPARSAFGASGSKRRSHREGQGSQTFVRSYRGGTATLDSERAKRLSLRESLGKAFSSKRSQRVQISEDVKRTSSTELNTAP